MKNRLKRIFKKKETVWAAPFALTILVDPVTRGVNWNVVNLGPVPYQLIYNGLDGCKDFFKLQEAQAAAKAKMEEEAKKNTVLKAENTNTLRNK